MGDDSEKSMNNSNKASILSRICAKFENPTIKEQTEEKIDINKLSDLEIAINMCKSGNLII